MAGTVSSLGKSSVGSVVNCGLAQPNSPSQPPIERCRATTANPETGQYDLNTLATLNGTFGHQDFGVYATVSKGGLITETDEVVFL